MSKVIYQEKQRFRDWGVFLMLGFIIVILIVKFVNEVLLSVGTAVTASTLLIDLAGFAGLGGITWYLLQLRLSLRVTDKSISVKSAPLFSQKQKIKLKDVEECEIVKAPPFAGWSGWNVHFNHCHRYGFVNHRGVHLRTKSGEDHFIGTNNLARLEEAIRKAFAQHRQA